jgi:hypothetical protein
MKIVLEFGNMLGVVESPWSVRFNIIYFTNFKAKLLKYYL